MNSTTHDLQIRTEAAVESAFRMAEDRYAEAGVNVRDALRRLDGISVSVHCWQGDDVTGFERLDTELGGGLAVTGNYPGRARTADELRADLELALSLVPGSHRINLHACYAETGAHRVDRNLLTAAHFARWTDWAAEHRLGLDFNPTFFSHPQAAEGLTLTHPDPGIRQFWIEHGIVSRRIAADMGRRQKSPSVCNVWIPDGMKDSPVDRKGPRERLTAALDAMFAEPLPPEYVLDAVECKLFGLGSESYVAGSHEFYLGYAIARQKLLCLDAGHFHPTESIADKISSVLTWVPQILLHVSRGVRWDSDHVVTLTDDLLAIAQEIVRGDFLGRVHLGLDFFDASINRIAAWVIGIRSARKALLAALLEPLGQLRESERMRDYTLRLALLEESKTLPLGAVWDWYCLTSGIPSGWLAEVRRYESTVLAARRT